MGIHALLLVRDEADVLPQVLSHLLEWCASIHVYDTGSTDGTWEIVHDFAGRERRVQPFLREAIANDLSLRGRMFERLQSGFRRGDWIMRADADEFYVESPETWLRERVRGCEGRVCTQQYEFVFTTRDLEAWERGEESVADRSRPICSRRRRFYVEPEAELRFCRYRPGMRWGQGHNLPFNPGHVAQERIGVRHYRWRDPPQMDARCRLRAACAKVTHHGPHWSIADWRRWVFDDADPRLHTWTPGTPLPARRGLEHLGPPSRRLAQRVMYASGLPSLLDRFRPTWSDGPPPAPFRFEMPGITPTPIDSAL